MGETGKAVFLSYAREDTAAAQRIAEALRSHGVEVWFDQSELRGGDAWDQKIRRQISECSLFLPVISRNTQERHKGYFRLEWKLAVGQTHQMAEGVAFVAPVVVDNTSESSAVVPPEFMRVQWTRLHGALPTPQFVEQIKRLLDAPQIPVSATRPAFPVPPSTPVAAGDVPAIARPAMGTRGPEPGRTGKRAPTFAIAVAALLIVAAGVWFLSSRSSIPDLRSPAPVVSQPAPISAKSIAVLPFSNLNTDPANESLAQGIQLELNTALVKIHDLTVTSSLSVMAYKNPDGRNLKKISSELGVASVLQGSVQREGGKVMVFVELIEARTGRPLWTETYHEDLTDTFTIQSKLASAITSALKATLSPEEKSLIARRPTENAEAYEFYLKGRALMETTSSAADLSRENLDAVAAFYNQAVGRDPTFALAYVQLVNIHGRQYWFGYLDSSPARKAAAKAALDAAVRLAPDSPETHLAQGIYSYRCDNDWARALTEFRVAQTGLPNDEQVINFIGLAQRRLGRLPEALVSFARAIELNPRYAEFPNNQTGTIQYLRRFPEAIALYARYTALFPNNSEFQMRFAASRLEFDHKRPAFFERVEASPPTADDPFSLQKTYHIAMWRGDLDAADRALADARLELITGAAGAVGEPVALHRALVAFLRGQRDSAQVFADQARAFLESREWAPRQLPWEMNARALALALAGREEEAVTLARDAFKLQMTLDAFAAIDQRPELAKVFLVLDRRDDAFAVLREMMTSPCPTGPEALRLDPLWARLKDDPRFEQILKLAKPL